MITLAQVQSLIRAFEFSAHLPMCAAWDAQKRAAVDAVRVYAHQNNLSLSQVMAALT